MVRRVATNLVDFRAGALKNISLERSCHIVHREIYYKGIKLRGIRRFRAAEYNLVILLSSFVVTLQTSREIYCRKALTFFIKIRCLKSSPRR